MVLIWKPYGFHIENIEYILVPEGMQWGVLMIKAMLLQIMSAFF